MQTYLEQLITHSTTYALIVVFVVSLLESLVLVGLILPGAVLMATLGALIGSGKVDFHAAWVAGTLGCLVGDWLSYCIGWIFQAPLHRWAWLQKHRALLVKTEYALYQHSMATILIGRFIGPTRPWVPLIAGMLSLPIHRFISPNLLGCLGWPPIYFLPGILAGVAVDIPLAEKSGIFKLLLLAFVLLLWAAIWLSWRQWRQHKRVSREPNAPGYSRQWHYASGVMWLLVLGNSYLIYQHPLWPVYLDLLWQVVKF